MKPERAIHCLAALGLAVLWLSVASPVHAQIYMWTNAPVAPGTYTLPWSDTAGWTNNPATLLTGGASGMSLVYNPTNVVGVTLVWTNDVGTTLLNTLTITSQAPNNGPATQVTNTITGGTLVFTNNGATLPVIKLQRSGFDRFLYNLNNNLVLTTNTTVTDGGGAGPLVNLNGTISGSGRLTLDGGSGGQVFEPFLNGTNDYTGGTTISAGNHVTINTDLNLGRVPSSLDVSNIILTAPGALNIQGTTPLVLNANRGVVLSGSGSIQLQGTGGVFNNPTNITGNVLVINGPISGPSTVSNNFSNLILTNNSNTFGGKVIIQNSVWVSSIRNIGQASALGQPLTADDGVIRLSQTGGGATLSYIGTGDSTDRKIDIRSLGTDALSADGTGAINFTSTAPDFVATNNIYANLFTLTGIGNGSIAGNLRGHADGTGPINTLVKDGVGTWILTGNNSWSNQTKILAGTLQADDGIGLPNVNNLGGGANLNLAGGVLQNNSASSFTRDVGTLSNQVQWTASGGFAAFTNKFTVLLNNSLTATQTWGSGSFVPSASTLSFGSTTASNTVEFQNPIDLNGAARTISVTDNTNTLNDIAVISGPIAGVTVASALTKQGAGVLALTGTNTYLGTTTISGGTLRADDGIGLPTAGTLTINGGVLEISTNFTRGLGAAAGKVQLTGNIGGFSAHGGNATVAITNTVGGVSNLVWGATTFTPSVLVLNYTNANSTLTFSNRIDLNAAVRKVEVDAATAIMSGVLTNGGLTKLGAGTLTLAAANTYNLATLVSAGSLIVNGSIVGSGVTVSSGAHLGGSGTISPLIGGAGSIDPGNSPGILTVNQVDPSSGLSFNFELTNAGTVAAPGLPNYANPLGSLNDVLRITNAAPFTVALTAANVVNLYIGNTVATTNAFQGGFYIDAGNFAGSITNATFRVYELVANGPVTYGTNQYRLATVTYFAITNVATTALGGANPFVTEFELTIIPEPSLLFLLAVGATLLGHGSASAAEG